MGLGCPMGGIADVDEVGGCVDMLGVAMLTGGRGVEQRGTQ
jgi:hypothetical protein